MSVAASNCSDAFTTPGVWLASVLERAEVGGGERERAAARERDSVAAASAAPSAGSVPLPISSSSTSVAVVGLVEDPAQHARRAR